MMRFVKFLCVLMLAVLLHPVARAADSKADVLAVVQSYLNAVNAGDVMAYSKLCTAHTFIMDDFAPYVWQGPNSCRTWIEAHLKDSKQNGVTDVIVKLGTPYSVFVKDGHAYVAVPATYTYKTRDKVVHASGADWTIGLQKTAAGWRIAGWSWSEPPSK